MIFVPQKVHFEESLHMSQASLTACFFPLRFIYTKILQGVQIYTFVRKFFCASQISPSEVKVFQDLIISQPPQPIRTLEQDNKAI